MNQNTTTPAAQPERGSRRGFEHSEGLRALLIRLHEEGRWAWRHDPEVAALMQYAADKYAALARRHGLDPWEAAAAAFDAMRTGAVRRADDPWAVITRAVKVTCIAEERANGLLCSVHQARRPKFSAHHDAERFSDRENPLTDYHESFAIPAPDYFAEPETSETSVRVGQAIEDAVALFHLLGWPVEAARGGMEYLVTRLAESASRAQAFESLRRDYHARALLDIPASSWLAMLRVVLGSPDPNQAHTSAARGVLHRLVIGEPLRALLVDDVVLSEVVLSAPDGGGCRGCE
ncbi:hypothetical protein [Leucobacter ruminantium]|uniref:Serine/arginine repetitive matrix protein 2 n=1 Tax=Leucobacter ruminantium TaxID=1289170 RepID=A0A939LXR4_9MICO|nr:hypothetical protein [Leucobacter ruminantium]MBO1806041.1 hypothetical protein [Leucobacter ruminantium]